jgi:homoserine kinase
MCVQVDKVVINVPATTANLGPGFDAFGFALDVWNRVTVQRADEFSMTITGEGADRLKNDQSNMVAQMTAKAFAALGQEMPPLRFECQNAIPPTRGMGSSSAALVAGLAAGLALGGKDMSTPATKKLLLQLAATEEGHADNVAPAIYGGFQIAFNTEEQWITQRVGLPEGLQCVLFIPDAEMSTTEARAVLPASVSYKDAIFNISRAAMLVNCFSTAQFDPLRYAIEDRLHQQYRSHMFPFDSFIKVALEAGAHGAYLSGAGPTVLAVAGGVGIADPGSDTMSQFLAEAVSEAMLNEARKAGLPGTVHIATPSITGVNSVGTAADGTVLWSMDQSRTIKR